MARPFGWPQGLILAGMGLLASFVGEGVALAGGMGGLGALKARGPRSGGGVVFHSLFS